MADPFGGIIEYDSSIDGPIRAEKFTASQYRRALEMLLEQCTGPVPFKLTPTFSTRYVDVFVERQLDKDAGKGVRNG